ncbi:MAG: hypothetical protein ACE5OY_05005 [Candidatus Bathyarchaeia archaeon]
MMIQLRRLSDRRGITPIVSEMLLLLVVVALMGAVLVWATGRFYSPEYLSAIQERLAVEDVWFSGGSIQLYVRNTGKVDLTIVAIYVNDQLVSGESRYPLGVQQGMSINLGSSWSPGESQEFLIVTERGSSFEFAESAP